MSSLKIWVLVLFFVTAESVSLAAEDPASCATNDMTEKMGPVRNQGDTQFCYSFAASDLLSEAMDISPADSVSALHLGAKYINANFTEREVALSSVTREYANPRPNWRYLITRSFFGQLPSERIMGYPSTAMTTALGSKQVCLESEVPSENKKEMDNFISKEIERSIGTSLKAEANSCEYDRADPLRYVQDVRNLTAAINDEASRRVLTYLSEKCKNPVATPKNLRVHNKWYDSTNGDVTDVMKKDINDLLGKSRPVSISFDQCLVKKCADGNSMHAVSIVAGRWNERTKSCQYKIRDSYGKSCDKKLKNNFKCENGHYWVDAKLLSAKITSIDWIEKL